MGNEKKFVTSWEEAENDLKNTGKVRLLTGGADTWNQKVAERLTKALNTKVLYVGMASSYTEMDGIHDFMVEAKNNKEAKGLLSKEYD